mmetsp:Transcript_27915/g.31028  ORF Transcript_27915/g.31028 Transcript_27915/m.31028 type:complete len:140 (-) Transcript_27915:78-497(-)|eukprot:CAMPEP_0168509590 /NCGR_PEP_ID=MMETSP0405-20121227/886_1 /TAXON_ID=498012 /ORGANISM="Trichosphaerium sp, Strain Am-I-7 wt" /LENGTH=139 /DNA_ID=CAMNT_0008527117 /DNA_START=248 /DNA_END=667 /DNA_ORIENTATION=+
MDTSFQPTNTIKVCINQGHFNIAPKSQYLYYLQRNAVVRSNVKHNNLKRPREQKVKKTPFKGRFSAIKRLPQDRKHVRIQLHNLKRHLEGRWQLKVFRTSPFVNDHYPGSDCEFITWHFPPTGSNVQSAFTKLPGNLKA